MGVKGGKKHQATWSGTYRPSTSEIKAYSHSKAVRASFYVAWKNAKEKAPYTAEESLVKPAAVTVARIMGSDAVANELAMVPLSNNTVKHERNFVGDAGDVSAHFFRRRGYNTPCPQWRSEAKCRLEPTIKVPPFQPLKFAYKNLKWKIMFRAYLKI